MLVMYRCLEDRSHLYSILKSDPNLSMLALKMPCPECDSSVEVMSPGPSHGDRGEVRMMSGLEMYQACFGRGFAKERDCSPDNLQKLALDGVIHSLDLEPVGEGDRSIINSIVLMCADGIVRRLHLSTSTKGATIYKVTDE